MGVTAIEASAGAVIVSVVEFLIESSVAWIVVLPWATLLASPVALIAATPAADELHVTDCVTSWVPPLMAAVAANCSVPPSGIEGVTGVTVIDDATSEGHTIGLPTRHSHSGCAGAQSTMVGMNVTPT